MLEKPEESLDSGPGGVGVGRPAVCLGGEGWMGHLSLLSKHFANSVLAVQNWVFDIQVTFFS